jgi:hypothetical protein
MKSENYTIGEVEYVIKSMSPRKASKILIRLIKMIGKPVASILSSAKGSDMPKGGDLLDADIDLKDAIVSLLSEITEEKFDKLLVDLTDSERITFSDPDFRDGDWRKIGSVDSHFDRYDIDHMYEFMFRVIELNYGGFLKKLWGLAGSEKSQSPKAVD